MLFWALRDLPNDGSLTGQLLVAMPHMADSRFARSVVYLCAHSAEGAMGLVVNRLIDSLSFDSLLDQLGLETDGDALEMPVHFGGPVESSRGFVLHSADYGRTSTLVIDEDIALPATIDVLKAIASGDGPEGACARARLCRLGAGQLDAEIQANGWLWCRPTMSWCSASTTVPSGNGRWPRSASICRCCRPRPGAPERMARQRRRALLPRTSVNVEHEQRSRSR